MGLEIALAVGLTGFAATAAGAAINIGAAFGLSYAANRLSGKNSARSGAGALVGTATTLTVAADAPRAIILGEAATAGSLIYYHAEGADNGTQCRLFALADHECHGLVAVIVNGVRKTVATNGHVDGFGGKLRIAFHSGAPGQVADAAVIAGSGGNWTAAHKGTGICYVAVWADFDEVLFPNDFPSLVFVVQGAKLFDPRTGFTSYSDNWGVCVYNLLRGVRQTPSGPHLAGLNAPASSIRLADVVASCNASDEAITLAAGGEEPRYRVGVVLYSNMTARQQLETVLAAGGDVIESAGIYRVLADIAQTPVATLTDADFIVDEPMTWNPRAPRSRLVNTIEGAWLAPSANYESTPLPPRTSSADRASDGGIRLAKTLDLSASPSGTQAQRVMEIARRQARRQGTASGTVRAAWCVLEPGDWIAVTSARYGWTGRVFAVLGAPQTEGMACTLSLAEVDAALDDWSVSDELDTNEAVNLPSGSPGAPGVGGLALENFTAEATTGAQRPGLRLLWTPVTDRTVVQFRVEFRRTGDAVPLELTVFDPRAGSHAWVTGVQSGAIYEARVLPVTQPTRPADWTGWVVAATASTNQIVPVAAYAQAVDPANLPPVELSEQEAFELALITATDEVLGSVSEGIGRALDEVDAIGRASAIAFRQIGRNRAALTVERTERLTATEALAQQITSAVAVLNGTIAQNVQEITALSTETTALAQSLNTLTTEVNGNTAQVTVLAASIDGIEGRIGLAVNVNGDVVGLVQLDGTAAGSAFTVAADKFLVALRGVTGGAAVPVFAIQNVAGVPKLAFRGDMYADGTITAAKLAVTELTAISAAFGDATVTGRLTGGPAGKLVIDFTTGIIRAAA